jgi:hypothetical protein
LQQGGKIVLLESPAAKEWCADVREAYEEGRVVVLPPRC